MSARVLIACLATAATVGGCGSSKQEAPEVLVGIGDQQASMFRDPHFKELGVRTARIIVPWNVALAPTDRRYLDDWLRIAREEGIEPLVHFGLATGSRCPEDPCVLPGVRDYAHAFAAFRRRWPFVHDLGAWNEANHRAQPTFDHPEQAARYYNVLRRECPGCRIVAADVLDDDNMLEWLAAFKRVAQGPRLWGLHNYRDTNPRAGQLYGGTKRLLSATRGEVWVTETGGLVKLDLANGRTLFPFSESRAGRAVTRAFHLVKRYRARIKRLYIYHWRPTNPKSNFDSGLLRGDGTPRPSYFAFRRELRSPVFRP